MSGPIKGYVTSQGGPGQGHNVTVTEESGNKKALDVSVKSGSVTGTFSVTGLNIGGRNTCMDITGPAAPIPPVPLAQRNAISVTNFGSDILYVGFSTAVTADLVPGITSGFQCGPNQGFNMDITPNVVLYAIAPAGKTIRLLITELA